MRPVNFQGPSGPNDFPRWATEAFREIERASRDGIDTAKGFYANFTPAQNIAFNVLTKLTNFVPVFDTTGHFSVSAQRWTPRAGLVHLHLQALSTPATAGRQIAVAIEKDGVLVAVGNAVVETAFDAVNGLLARVAYADNANGTNYYEAFFITTGSEATPQVLAQTATSFYGIEL